MKLVKSGRNIFVKSQRSMGQEAEDPMGTRSYVGRVRSPPPHNRNKIAVILLTFIREALSSNTGQGMGYSD
jgi:hypothetical protein